MSGSVLDRLLDRAADGRGQALAQLEAAVRRDLQALLNARRPWASTAERFAGLQGSMLGYGLPDFAAGAFNEPAARDALCREIAATIRRFEPRLTQPVVKLRDRPETMEPVLRIRIEGLLRAEGAPEPVGFDSVIDATTTGIIVGARSGV